MLRSKFKFSNVAALLALVLAISGGAYAADKINGSRLAPKSVKGGKLATDSIGQRALKQRIVNNIFGDNVFFHTTEPGNTISIGAGGDLEFSGVQVGQGITPVSDTEFRFDRGGSYRVTLVMSIAEVIVGGSVLYQLDGVPSHLKSGNVTAGAQLTLDGVVVAGSGQVLNVISETGLEVQLSSGTEATLVIHKVGPPMKPIREAIGADVGVDAEAPEPAAG